MRRSVWSVVALLGILFISVPDLARADDGGRDLDERSRARMAKFSKLWSKAGEIVEGTYSGRLGDDRVYFNKFGSSVSGDGPQGYLSLHMTDTSVFGRSGDHRVSLYATGSSVTGQGPRGYVNLWISSRSVMGRVGNQRVSVNAFGNSVTGSIGDDWLSLHGYDPLEMWELAAIIGSL